MNHITENKDKGSTVKSIQLIQTEMKLWDKWTKTNIRSATFT